MSLYLRHRWLDHRSNNATFTNLFDDEYNQDDDSWEAPWDVKAAILLGQGITITVLVALVLFVCARKHYRRMSIYRLQELTTIRINEMGGNYRDTNGEDNGDNHDEERTRLQRIMRVLGTPLRFIDSWVSSPSTDFDYYDRILQRMEREKEARMEGVEDRTKRLMNAFAKGQCVWEIEDKHFSPPFLPDKTATMIHVHEKANVESDVTAAAGPACREEMIGITTVLAIGSKKTTKEEIQLENSMASEEQEPEDLDQNKNHEEKSNSFIENESANSTIESGNVQSDLPTEPAPDLLSSSSKTSRVTNTLENLRSPTSFDDIPGYLYLDLSQIRSNKPISTAGKSISTSMATPPPTQKPSNNQQRTIPNQCAICLCDYTKGDNVVISSNTSCHHAFHQECIIEWLVKMQEGTPCPCCRQTFVELENVEDNRAAARARREMSDEELGALRRHLQLGLQRGRAFDASVIRF